MHGAVRLPIEDVLTSEDTDDTGGGIGTSCSSYVGLLLLAPQAVSLEAPLVAAAAAAGQLERKFIPRRGRRDTGALTN